MFSDVHDPVIHPDELTLYMLDLSGVQTLEWILSTHL